MPAASTNGTSPGTASSTDPRVAMPPAPSVNSDSVTRRRSGSIPVSRKIHAGSSSTPATRPPPPPPPRPSSRTRKPRPAPPPPTTPAPPPAPQKNKSRQPPPAPPAQHAELSPDEQHQPWPHTSPGRETEDVSHGIRAAGAASIPRREPAGAAVSPPAQQPQTIRSRLEHF